MSDLIYIAQKVAMVFIILPLMLFEDLCMKLMELFNVKADDIDRILFFVLGVLIYAGFIAYLFGI